MERFGEIISEARKAAGLSQADFAKFAGVSQGTISRIESSEDFPADIQLLAKVARAIKKPLIELIPDDLKSAIFRGPNGERFYAFCANPFCEANKIGRNRDGAPNISWTSGREYSDEHFAEINFCTFCGEDLVKECPNCTRRLDKGAKFCVTCGKKVTERPTAEEWVLIGKKAPVALVIPDGQVNKPFSTDPDSDIPF